MMFRILAKVTPSDVVEFATSWALQAEVCNPFESKRIEDKQHMGESSVLARRMGKWNEHGELNAKYFHDMGNSMLSIL